jgi:hypothetical protein
MNFLPLLALLLSTPPHAFQLAPGDYRWIPFTVVTTPTQVDCRFEVLQGAATVRVELLPMREFRAFAHGREHDTLAALPDSHGGSFRRMVDEPGQYAVIAINERNAPPATVSLEMATDINPNADLAARELPAGRRLAVIVVSFGLFFALVSFSGFRLLRGIRPS